MPDGLNSRNIALAAGGLLAGAAVFVAGSEIGVTPYNRQAPTLEAATLQADPALRDAESEVARLQSTLAERDANIATLNATLDALADEVKEARATLEASQDEAPPVIEAGAEERDAEIARLENLLAEREATLAERDAALADRDAELAAIATRIQAPDTPPAVAAALAAVLETPTTNPPPDSAASPVSTELASLTTGDKPDAPDLGAIQNDLASVEAALAAAKDVQAVNGPPSPPSDMSLGQVQFETASATLTPGGLINMLQAAKAARELGLKKIEVLGFTDTVGQPEFNRQLAGRRAEAVANALVDAGLPRDMIIVAGMGETGAPISTPDNTAEPLNRCVGIFPHIPGATALN